jgi:nucleotide-binding universal stress UspA family protein
MDFSEQSHYALGLACSLARDYRARLVVLHVVPVPSVVYGEGVVPPNPEQLRLAAQHQLDDLPIPDANLQVERRLMEGDPAEVIVHVAREGSFDLVVLGTHGRTGLGRVLMGSVAEQVVRKAPCPVLTVRTPIPEMAPAKATVVETAPA